MAVDEKLTSCPTCGAPRVPGVVICGYCSAPLVDDLELHAIPCWSCKTWNEWEATDCSKCDSNLLVPCLQCKESSPHHLGRCIRCGATF